MEIDLKSIPRHAGAAQSTSSRGEAADLLRALTQAGKVEAEVLQRLPGELLIGTRFGQFRIDSRLDISPGVKLSLRVDSRGSEPVLRATSSAAETLRLPLTGVPSLSRLMAGTDLVLAELRGSSGGQSELRTGDRLLRLPLELPSDRGGLWLLRRSPDGATIEIEPVSRGEVLRAILLHLLPRDRGDAELALPRLLQWAAKLMRAGKPGVSNAQPLSATSTPPTALSRLTNGAANVAATAPKPKPVIGSRGNAPGVPLLAQRSDTSIARAGAVSARIRGNSLNPTRETAGAVSRSLPAGGPDSSRSAQPASLPQATDTAPRSEKRNGNTTSTLGPATSSRRGDGPATAPRTTSFRSVPPERNAAAAISTGRVASASLAGPAAPSPPLAFEAPAGSPRPASAAVAESADPAHATRTQTALKLAQANSIPQPEPRSERAPVPATAVAPSRVLNAALQQWFGELPRLPDIEPGLLRRWLASTDRPRLTAAYSAPAAVSTLAVLRQSLQREISLNTELAGQVRGSSRIELPLQADAGSSEETRLESRLPGWLRDGARLVEQAIGQSLLQRVTTALQTESQQPLTLHLAMPFLDAAEARPLILEIEQQGRETEDAESRWEFRLRFEIEGLGPICCQLRLEGQRVGASFYCEWPATHVRVEAALPELRRQLDQAGFAADELASFAAALPARDSAKQWRCLESLIDLRA